MTPAIVLEYQARYAAQLISGKIQLPSNFSSLRDAVIAAKARAASSKNDSVKSSGEKEVLHTVLVNGKEEQLTEFDMAANLFSLNPAYCSKLARLTNSQGYWSQMCRQRLRWFLSTILYSLCARVFPPAARWLSKMSCNGIVTLSCMQ